MALEQHNVITMEIVDGSKIQAVINVAISKNLIVDVYNQVKTSSIVISADATNCYDRIAYLFASLTAQQFGVNVDYIMVL